MTNLTFVDRGKKTPAVSALTCTILAATTFGVGLALGRITAKSGQKFPENLSDDRFAFDAGDLVKESRLMNDPKRSLPRSVGPIPHFVVLGEKYEAAVLRYLGRRTVDQQVGGNAIEMEGELSRYPLLDYRDVSEKTGFEKFNSGSFSANFFELTTSAGSAYIVTTEETPILMKLANGSTSKGRTMTIRGYGEFIPLKKLAPQFLGPNLTWEKITFTPTKDCPKFLANYLGAKRFDPEINMATDSLSNHPNPTPPNNLSREMFFMFTKVTAQEP